MAFLKFRIGSNNYELRDVTDCHIFGGEYYKSLTETSRVYDLILTSNKKMIMSLDRYWEMYVILIV